MQAVGSQSPAPESCRDQLDGCEEAFRGLVVSSGDAAKPLEPVEEPLHEVSLPMVPAGKGEGALALRFRRDVGPSLARRLGAKDVGVVTLVGKQDVARAESLGQGLRSLAIGDLAS
jgi:hypothetical protein